MFRHLLLVGTVLAVTAHLDIEECGKSKHCVMVPHGCKDDCRTVFTYKPSQQEGWTDMELYSALDSPNNNYISVGFSADDLMGDDSVTHCAFPSEGTPEAHLTYNVGKTNSPLKEDADFEAEKKSLELVHAHKDEKSMYCQLRQRNDKGEKQHFPSLDQDYHIFLARGKAKKNPRSIGIHSLDPSSPDFPFISDKAMNIAAALPLAAAAPNTTQAAPAPSSGMSKEVRFLLVKLHGILMLPAWFLLVNMAVLSARYLRDHFPTSSPLGLKWWFHLHRSFNVLAVPLILLSTLLIFIAKDWQWKGPVASADFDYNTNPGAVHSLAGTIAILAAIFNPLMSLLRCAPDTGARPLFNWSHRILGVVGIVCAAIAIFIASNSFVSLFKDSTWAFVVVILYLVVFVVAIILLEVLSYLKTKRSDKVAAAYELRNRGSRYDDQGRVVSNTKVINTKPMHGITLVYVLFGLFALAVIVFLVLMIIP